MSGNLRIVIKQWPLHRSLCNSVEDGWQRAYVHSVYHFRLSQFHILWTCL